MTQDSILAAADVVVVGAGSAGCVLAARLAEAGQAVTLVEAGPDSRSPLLSVPLMTGALLRGHRFTRHYESEPVPGLNDRRLDWPRGRVVGGSGAINGMVHLRGLAHDYRLWAQQGLTDWSWEKVLPHFLAAEARLEPARPGWDHPLYEAYLAAAEAAGQPRARDLNDGESAGAGRYVFNIRGGRRAHSARRYLDRVRDRVNLVAGATVTGLTFAGRRCTGVAAERGGRRLVLPARRMVVLCAGVIGSPQLLLLSGIGPAAELAALGIPAIADSPDVGRNLQDHLLIRVEYASRREGPLHRLLRADRAALAVLRAHLFGSGPAATFPLLAGGFFRSAPGLDQPDIQSHFLPALSSATLRINPFRRPAGARAEDGLMANASQMRPESRGWLRLASPDPRSPPLIQPNYLAAEGDRQVMRAAVRLLRHIFAQAPFDPWRGAEIAPGPAVQSDDEIDAFVRETAGTMFHPVGTCRMGVDDRAVVDQRLAVRGVGGLMVADASVMPLITSANTQAPTVMIAERAATLLG
ncbi:MAG: choline dehydrogenase [Thalassobaculales bacterium]